MQSVSWYSVSYSWVVLLNELVVFSIGEQISLCDIVFCWVNIRNKLWNCFFIQRELHLLLLVSLSCRQWTSIIEHLYPTKLRLKDKETYGEQANTFYISINVYEMQKGFTQLIIKLRIRLRNIMQSIYINAWTMLPNRA